MKEKNGFSVLKEEISQNNVLAMAELIAMAETRFLIGYMGSAMQKMHADLYLDILHKNEFGYALSDSYDLVQEGALFLCEHYGKHLSDVIFYSKKGKPITIEIACIRKMTKLINRKTSNYYRNVSFEALTPASEPYTEMQEETIQDYATYDSSIKAISSAISSTLFCEISSFITLKSNIFLVIWIYLRFIFAFRQKRGSTGKR